MTQEEACKEVMEEGCCDLNCIECPIHYGKGLSEDWYDDDDEDYVCYDDDDF